MGEAPNQRQLKVQHLVDQATWFGKVADLYDRSRPSYPLEMVADLLRPEPVDIVDVGCGTGKAASLFVGAGRRVLGIEPDTDMAAVARANDIQVEVGRFESWADDGRRFDLLISGTAWHWVDPGAGAAKAAEVLRPGGHFAAFWNSMHHTAPVRAVFAEVYGRHAPQVLATSPVLGRDGRDEDEPDIAGLAIADGPFTDVVPGKRRVYQWALDYTPQAWGELVATHSDHRLLPPDVLQGLRDDLVAALGALGERFSVGLETELLHATRR